MSGYRLSAAAAPAAQIDRSRPIGFRFNGAAYRGYAGDTLASALVAAGVSIVGRSFKYHRPRGVMGTGFSEPNALVQLGTGARTTPNLPASLVPLSEGLEARSVNCWPSAAFDLGAVNDRLSPLLVAGFYYKTFIWPSWGAFEPFIRRAAGLGRSPALADPDRYEARNAQCDVLVVGAGPAGLMAALAAARAGARVMLAEADQRSGGGLGLGGARVGAGTARDWIAEVEAELDAAANVTVLGSTAVTGYYDHNLLTAVQEVDEPGLRQRFWKIRAGEVVLATGALERPLLFAGNDRPGVMLAGAVRTYVERYAAAPGRRMVLAANNDAAYEAAFAAARAGIEVAAIVDERPAPGEAAARAADALGLRRVHGRIMRAIGARGVRAVEIVSAAGTEAIACDLVAASGGWTPAVQLFSQSGGLTRFDEALGGLVPDRSVQRERSCGAAAGVFALPACLAGGAAAGAAAAQAAGFEPPAIAVPEAEDHALAPAAPLPPVPAKGKVFVDVQTDVTVADLQVATRENYRSVEHVKRYTVWGMGVDQGKLSGANGVAVLAAVQGVSGAEMGMTKFRPPFMPAAFGVLAAARPNGALFHPWKRLPAHLWHERRGAVFEDFGWLRPAYYPLAGETMAQATAREVRAVREAVGLLDASSLGKIEVRGPDAGAFLDHIYAGPVDSLPVGGVRYGLMLNELGAVFDDGVVARLAADHFLLTTSSAHAAAVLAWLEDWRQGEWPMAVVIQDATSQWATFTLSGPRARKTLAAAGTSLDLSPAAFPRMTIRTGEVAGLPARVQRASFTGATTYEISVAARSAERLADALWAAGAPFGLQATGVEALEVLRTERGAIDVGIDTDSTTLPGDLGLPFGGKACDYLGKRSLTHPAASAPGRKQLVGLQTLDPLQTPPVGAHVIGGVPHPSQGVVTSSQFSPTLGRSIALALLTDGRSRLGETVQVWSEGRVWPARVTGLRFLDHADA
ncbi:MAG: 2Fe-2S iron-sulfur cluster-binding protein [Caulobacteraceae bacterium]|nr:2Fe-2S iron-sulfur cluster-binding protein [Caulobacteraceae bacterium]